MIWDKLLGTGALLQFSEEMAFLSSFNSAEVPPLQCPPHQPISYPSCLLSILFMIFAVSNRVWGTQQLFIKDPLSEWRVE
jgi:hypothetical protein